MVRICKFGSSPHLTIFSNPSHLILSPTFFVLSKKSKPEASFNQAKLNKVLVLHNPYLCLKLLIESIWSTVLKQQQLFLWLFVKNNFLRHIVGIRGKDDASLIFKDCFKDFSQNNILLMLHHCYNYPHQTTKYIQLINLQIFIFKE